jgi:hypothetical protein
VADDALFPEPEHTPPRTDGRWLVAPAPGCWRYMILGEDGQWLMIDGHSIRDGELVEVIRAADQYDDGNPGWADSWGEVARRVWARQHDRCPKHLAYADRCPDCAVFRAGEGPVFTWTPHSEPDDSDRGKPGYFPVTVIDLEG